MSSLANQQINSSYNGILQIPGGITNALQTVQDGNGNSTGLQISTTSVNVPISNNYVASVADLRAVSSSQVTFIFVESYYGVGPDGGGGNYEVISLTSSGYTDNGGTIIIANDGAVWKLISTNKISVKQFGAKGDGSTDDTSAFASALSNVNNLYIPLGKYVITNQLTKTFDTTVTQVSNGFSITGDGMGASQIVFRNGSGLTLNLNGAPGMTVEQLSFLADQTSGTAIYVTETIGAAQETTITFRDIEVTPLLGLHDPARNWIKGIVVDKVRFVRFDNCRLSNGHVGRTAASTTYGISITSTTSQANIAYVGTGNWITGFNYGLYSAGWIEGIYWFGGEIWGCDWPVYADRTGATFAGAFRFDSVHMSGGNDVFTAIYAAAVGVSNCDFYRGSATGTPASTNVLSLVNCQSCQVTGNKIEDAYIAANSTGVLISSSKDVSVSGNTIRNINGSGVKLTGTVDLVNVGANTFYGDAVAMSIGVQSASATTNCYVGINSYENVGTYVYDPTYSIDSAVAFKTSAVVTLGTGTSPAASTNITIPAGYFFAPPRKVVLTSAAWDDLMLSYDFSNGSTTATNLVVIARNVTGTNIPLNFSTRINVIAYQ